MMKILITQGYEGTAIHVYQLRGPNGRWARARPVELVFEEIEEGKCPDAPFLKLPVIYSVEFFEALKEAIEPIGKKREAEIKLQIENKMLKEQIADLREILSLKTKGTRRIEL